MQTEAGHLTGLSDAISVADVIVFDAFDTLFIRPRMGVDPHRSQAGKLQGGEAAQLPHLVGSTPCTINDDKKKLAEIPAASSSHPSHLSVLPTECSQEEYACALSINYANQEMFSVLRGALTSGKKVVITSDVELQAFFLKDLMAKHDLQSIPLFIPESSHGPQSGYSTLFDRIASELNVSNSQILYIGNGLTSELFQAKRGEVRTFTYNRVVPGQPEGISAAAAIARVLHRIHQKPVRPGSMEELGFMTSGPAAVGFIDWIADQARRDHVDHILFVCPVGSVLQELAEFRRTAEPATMPPSSCLLGSRVALKLAGMTPKNFDLSFLLSDSEGLAPVELLERIGVPAPADHVLEDLGLGRRTILRSKASKSVSGLLRAWRWEILKICQRNRRGLFRQLLDLGLRAGQRVAVVDLGWTGDAQVAFATAVREVMPLEMVGYSFCLSVDNDGGRSEAIPMRSLVGSDALPPNFIRSVLANRAACEFLLAPAETRVIGCVVDRHRVIGIEDRGRAVAGNFAATAAELRFGIVSFAHRFNSLRDRLGLAADPLGMAMPLLDFVADGEWAENALLKQVRNFDPWTSSRNCDRWLTDYAVRQN